MNIPIIGISKLVSKTKFQRIAEPGIVVGSDAQAARHDGHCKRQLEPCPRSALPDDQQGKGKHRGQAEVRAATGSQSEAQAGEPRPEGKSGGTRPRQEEKVEAGTQAEVPCCDGDFVYLYPVQRI